MLDVSAEMVGKGFVWRAWASESSEALFVLSVSVFVYLVNVVFWQGMKDDKTTARDFPSDRGFTCVRSALLVAVWGLPEFV